jgi:hypothetical protein
VERNTPEIRAPRPLLATASQRQELAAPASQPDCRADSCLDFSRCSIRYSTVPVEYGDVYLFY